MRLGRQRKSRLARAVKRRAPESGVDDDSLIATTPEPSSVDGVAVDEALASARVGGRKLVTPQRIAFAGVAVLAVATLLPFESHVGERMANAWGSARMRFEAFAGSVGTEAAAPVAPSGEIPSASAELPAAQPPTFRPGRGPLGGGVFSLPEDLRIASDGSVDVLIHFHGNTEMVLESAEYAKLGAATVVVNLGVGSGPYEDHFDNPVNFTDLLTRIEGAIEKRGVEHAKLGRIALSSWSAGYGAVLRILKNDGLAPKIDAVILLDGMHVGYREDGALNWLSIQPFQAYAERAVRGETLFVVTHSNIEPVGYLGVKETSDHILEHFGMTRQEVTGATAFLPFESFKGVMPKADMIPLTRASEAQKGNFLVRGYRGNEPHTHMAHLMEMSEIGLAELARRWGAGRSE